MCFQYWTERFSAISQYVSLQGVVKSGGKLDCEYAVSLGHFHNVGTLTMSPQLIAEKRQDRHHIVLETRADVGRKVVEKGSI